ncbi:MAG: MBL fold metallo-hydrolase [Muribaculaceae bacterium]|nr:MBL fold metallo-hydrolase [Muribaculaceae bacterium]
MKITFLGTGTSIGVPVIGCNCEVCRSRDPRDKRLRSCVLVQTQGRGILIDCGPDFRYQMLRAGAPPINAVLLTHSHYDHVGGLDDMRPYTHRHPNMPVFCSPDVADDIRNRLPYCFAENPYPGTPSFALNEVTAEADSILVEGLPVTPLAVMHGRLPILGWRIGPFAYITDASFIPDETFDRLHGIDTLVINALREKPHPAHFNFDQALAAIDRIAPRRAYLTHFAMEAGLHAAIAAHFPATVLPAHDTLTLSL